MKTNNLTNLIALGLLVAVPVVIFGQGGDPDVIPPGAFGAGGHPQAVFKTLDEVRPGTPLTSRSTPGDDTAVFAISEPGVFYLTGDVAVPAGKTGIRITASNVDLDLGGFTVRGVEGSLFGVLFDGAGRQLVMRHGTIEALGRDGVDAVQVSGARLSDITVRNCGGRGIDLGDNNVLESVVCRGNGGTGFAGGAKNIVNRSVFSENGHDGADIGQGGVLTNVLADDNGSDGLETGSESRVENCSANGNARFGICLGQYTTASACIAARNGDVGFDLGNESNVSDCVAAENGGFGFELSSEGTLESCTATRNEGAGFGDGDEMILRGCIAKGNGDDGFDVGSASLIVDCVSEENEGDGISVVNDSTVRNCSINNCGNRDAPQVGIRVEGRDNRIEGNHVLDTHGDGIAASGRRNLIVRNTCSVNSGEDFAIEPENTVGPIVAGGTGVINTSNPWANFRSASQ